MKKILKNWDLLLLIVLLIIGAFLRYWNIHLLEFFTYDQARDALFVKRIVVDHIPRLLGTQTSLPGMYLPPFYYFTITPILYIFKLNPIGIDIYSATIGVLTIALVYFVANKIFGKPAGIFAASLYAVSPLTVELSKRAWNPNTLPFYILAAFYFLWKYFQKKNGKDLWIAYLIYGYCLSLHFAAWTLLPLFSIPIFNALKSKVKIKYVILSILSIAFLISPLVIFELRHGLFLASQAKIFFFDGNRIGLGGNVGLLEGISTAFVALFAILFSGKILPNGNAPLEFSGKFLDFFKISEPISVVAQKPFSLTFAWWGIALLIAVIVLTSWNLIKSNDQKLKGTLLIMTIWLFWGLLVSRLYAGKFFFFYYLFLFPVPFLFFGYIAKFFWKNVYLKFICLLICVLIVGYHLKNSRVFDTYWRNYDDLMAVAKIIGEDASSNSFNIATYQKDPDRWDHNSVDYRYFVEAYFNKTALSWYPDDYKKAEVLYVVAEDKFENPIGSNIMEIYNFSPKIISNTWKTNKDIVIYKLTK